MSDEEPRPFLAGQRREILRDLATEYARGADARVIDRIAAGLDPDQVKLDGKAGALDGVFTTGRAGLAEMGPIGPPICVAYPGLPPKHKEGKDGKENKDGKEAKDGKEDKEGKEAKDGKEDKDSSDGGKLGGDENQDPFDRFGEIAVLPLESFEAIAATHVERVELAVQRGSFAPRQQ